MITYRPNTSSIREIQSGNSNSRPYLLVVYSIIRAKVILYMDWCPSQYNIFGNDLDDEAAKTVSSIGKELSLKLGKTEAYGKLRKKIKQPEDHWSCKRSPDILT